MKKIDHSNEYVIYARRSTDDAENQKNSLDYQVGAGEGFSERAKLPVANSTIDGYMQEGIIQERHSAFKTAGIQINAQGQVVFDIERPKFQKLVRELMEHKYKGVIALCWDRLSRNEQDAMVIKSLIDDYGVDVRFVQANYEQSASGALHRDIDGMFATHYSREISQKVRQTLDKLRASGRCTYVAPIGYLDEGSDRKVIDPERAPIVIRIFELYATAEWSFSQLAIWARQQGLTTKPMRPHRTKMEMLANEENTRERVCRPVTIKSIENMLSNPFYIGKLRFKDSIIQGSHPALISAGLFYKVQAALVKRRMSLHHPDKDFFEYRGVIKCSCGRSYSPYIQKGQTYLRAKCKEGCTNPNPNLSNEQVHEYVQSLLTRISFTNEELSQIEAKAHRALNKAADVRDKKRHDLQRRIDRIYSDLDYLKKEKITLLRAQTMSPEEYTAEIARLENEHREVQISLGEIHESEHDMLKYILTFSELVKRAGLYYKFALDVEKHQIITQVFSELCFSNNEFSFVAKDGFSALFSRHEQKKTHHAGRDVYSGSPDGLRLEPHF